MLKSTSFLPSDLSNLSAEQLREIVLQQQALMAAKDADYQAIQTAYKIRV